MIPAKEIDGELWIRAADARIKEAVKQRMEMEMSKHTPGPWHIDPIKAHANGNRRIMAEQCTPVAVVPEHLAADARLIAAAPDLLEALTKAATMLHPDLDEYKAVRAAIAKATGGAA